MLAERSAFDELGRDEMRLSGLPDVVYGEDVRMVKRRGRTRFLCKASQPVFAFRKFFGQYFLRDLAVKAGIFREIYLTHPARAEF
jgi:hypothetical protein